MMAFNISTVLNPGRVAVLFSEVQRGVVGDLTNHFRGLADIAEEVGVLRNGARLADAARARGAPVVHCLASGAPGQFGQSRNIPLLMGLARRAQAAGWVYNPEADTPCPEVWRDGDVVASRVHGMGPMADSALDQRLRNAGITTVIVAGVSLNVAATSLTLDCANRGYQVIVAKDAVAGIPREYGEAVLTNSLAMVATLASVDDIIAAWAQTEAVL
jgi:nicotinamidase-related amidase